MGEKENVGKVEFGELSRTELMKRYNETLPADESRDLCPWCLSQDVASSNTVGEGSAVTRHQVCLNCGASWFENLEVTYIEPDGSYKLVSATDLRKTLYCAYQLEWMLSHGHSVEELCCAVIDPEDGLENGFGGDLWVCYDEFVDTEYRDFEYVAALLDLMDLTPEDIELYKRLHEADVDALELERRKVNPRHTEEGVQEFKNNEEAWKWHLGLLNHVVSNPEKVDDMLGSLNTALDGIWKYGQAKSEEPRKRLETTCAGGKHDAMQVGVPGSHDDGGL